MALNVEFTLKGDEKVTFVDSDSFGSGRLDAYLDEIPADSDLAPASNTRRLRQIREEIGELVNSNTHAIVKDDETGEVQHLEYRSAISGYTADGELVFIPGSEVTKVRIFQV